MRANSAAKEHIGSGPGGIPGVYPVASGNQNCAWMRAPWGEEDDGLHAERRTEVKSDRYQRAVSRLLKEEVLYVKFSEAEGCLTIKIRGGTMRDFGDCLVMENGTDREIACLGKLVGFKQWQSLELSGSSRFREQAMLECLRYGVQVLGCSMPEHLRARLMEMKREPARPVLRPVAAPKPRSAPKAAEPLGKDAEREMLESVEHYILDMLSD